MLQNFFFTLRNHKLPVSLRDYLNLLAALDANIIETDFDQFHTLARGILIKDERLFDRFDRAFGQFMAGIEGAGLSLLDNHNIPDDWLKKLTQRYFTREEMAEIEALGGFDAVIEALKQRLAEQKERHEGGNKWIGTGGTSPFGHGGFNPEGINMAPDGARSQGQGIKVWNRRPYKDLDDGAHLGTRQIKMALRRLRQWANEGAQQILDLDETISGTARQGYLDIITKKERINAVKLLIFFDIGGSMDAHIAVCEALFSAAKAEMRHIHHYYFHNCIYENVWKENRRREGSKTLTYDLLNSFGPDYKVIMVGDASMSPYEITYKGGSVEHWNEEEGAVWLSRVKDHFSKLIWINPIEEKYWNHSQSTYLISQIIGAENMVPMSLAGLERGMKILGH